MDWLPIETAPKDGRPVLCGWAGKPGFTVLMWKTNDRIVSHLRIAPDAALTPSYFGDMQESDDYDLATPGNGPTHWFPVPDITGQTSPPPVPRSLD